MHVQVLRACWEAKTAADQRHQLPSERQLRLQLRLLSGPFQGHKYYEINQNKPTNNSTCVCMYVCIYVKENSICKYIMWISGESRGDTSIVWYLIVYTRGYTTENCMSKWDLIEVLSAYFILQVYSQIDHLCCKCVCCEHGMISQNFDRHFTNMALL